MTPPKYVLSVLNTLTSAGFEAYLAGGCVRDALLSRRPQDWDAATDALPEQVQELFSRTVPTGIAHGTVTVLAGGGKVEVTSFRADGEYSDHRHPDHVDFIPDLAGDLSRRDFTINAMAMDAAGKVIDHFGGRDDLAAGLIRCVGAPEERFSEDALRMLRAIRFSAQLGFEIEAATRAAIYSRAPLCKALSPERVRDELIKTLRSPAPEMVWDMLDAGLLDAFVKRGGPETAARRRSLKGLPLYARLPRWCAELEGGGYIMSTHSLLTALRLDNQSVRTASGAVEILRGGGRDWKRLLRDYGEAAVLAAYPKSKELRHVLASGECYDLGSLELKGGDLKALGYSGRELGRLLDAALEHVIDNPGDNNKYKLCKLIESWRAENG